MFKGLVDYMPSDAELAGVLGHEIGHVVKRHTVHQLEKNMWTQLAAILAGVASGNGDVLAMGMVVGDALAAGYSRADESAARGRPGRLCLYSKSRLQSVCYAGDHA